MPKAKNPCAFCGRKAERLCDYRISIVADDHSRYITCDTPLCTRCTNSTGYINVKASPRSFVETWDFCPIHENPEDLFSFPVRPLMYPSSHVLAQHEKEVLQWRENHRVAIARHNIIPVESANGR